jgi:hypothetical protein
MTPEQLANAVVEELKERDIAASPDRAIDYGHKIAVFSETGTSLGNIVVYVGRHGPKPSYSELRRPTPEMFAKVKDAWAAALRRLEASSGAPSPAQAPTAEAPQIDKRLLDYAEKLAELSKRRVAYTGRAELVWDGLGEAIASLAAQLGYSLSGSAGSWIASGTPEAFAEIAGRQEEVAARLESSGHQSS